MELENTFTVPLPVERAWPVLMDVERVLGCVPGATLESVDGDNVRARVRVKLGPISMTYRGEGHFAEKDEQAKRVVIRATGKDSKGSGAASATVRTSLHERSHGETEVHVLTELKLTGKPAQFGRGAIQEVTSTLIGRFADSLAAELAVERSGASDIRTSASPDPSGLSGGAGAEKTAVVGHKRAPAKEDHLNLLDAMGKTTKRTVAKGGGVLLLILVLALLAWYLIK